ncbi:MAG: hypothetical protein A2460_07820, partial [Omnitrophica WOR_2 bacterium RIFOXYC2_FULL_43_9]
TQFWFFFVIVYLTYLILPYKLQNRLLLIASCVFYGAWDWRFLILMGISTLTDFICSLQMQTSDNSRYRKYFLWLSISIHLLILCFFKYFNFFASGIHSLFNVLGIPTSHTAIHIILPVGISFYTFKGISYTIDCYRKEISPTRNLWDYALFVSYFPQLVAGPIERAAHLLPQIENPRTITRQKISEGIYLIVSGLFQKIFIADNLALIVNTVFQSPSPYIGARVLLAVYAFALQIYCDFAGYSNIARGLGKIMGFDIMLNFNLPYFSSNPSEFWKKWHITLSSWLRDYLYIPLGGNRRGVLLSYRNILITMLLGGLWHGAGWTFLLWGAYHGILIVLYKIISPVIMEFPHIKNTFLLKCWKGIKIVFFFHLVCMGWLIFRARSFGQIIDMLSSLGGNLQIIKFTQGSAFSLAFFLSLLVIMIQFLQFKYNDPLLLLNLRVRSKILLLTMIIYCSAYAVIFGGIYQISHDQKFIYFQF